MPKLLSFLARIYPFLFLALVVAGPLLLLPPALPVFSCAAVAVTVFRVCVFVAVAGFCAAHYLAPAAFKELTGPTFTHLLAMTGGQKVAYYLHRAADLAGTAVLFLTAHPIVAAAGLACHVAWMVYRFLLSRAHRVTLALPPR